MGRQGAKESLPRSLGQSMATLAWTQHRMLARRVDSMAKEKLNKGPCHSLSQCLLAATDMKGRA